MMNWIYGKGLPNNEFQGFFRVCEGFHLTCGNCVNDDCHTVFEDEAGCRLRTRVKEA